MERDTLMTEQRDIFQKQPGAVVPAHPIANMPAVDERITTIFTDGGVIQANKSPYGGSWAFVGVTNLGQRVLEDSGLVIIPAGRLISNNTTEFMAATRAFERMEDGWSGMVFTDSENVIKRFTAIKKYGERANCDGLPSNAKARGIVALRRMGEITWAHCDGHPSKAELAIGLSKKGRVVSIHNVRCDELCTLLQEAWKKGEGADRFRRGQAGLCHLCGFNLKEFNAPGGNPYICLTCAGTTAH